jgi:N-methylhydantoinase A
MGRAEAAEFRVGIDVGGTFTDVVAARPGTDGIIALKVPTTPADPAQGVLAGLRAVQARTGRIQAVTHGTTLVTNAIVERRGSPPALVTTRGFRDILEIARQSRTHLYRLSEPLKPPPLVPRRLRFEVTERLGPGGEVLTPLAEEELPALVEALGAAGVEAVAVCLLHAYANPEHEQRLKTILGAAVPYISLSTEINAEFREYERTSTVVLNAFAMPLAGRYLARLRSDLAQEAIAGRLHLVQANGGMISAEMAEVRPLAMAMSGPAAGVAATRHLLRAVGQADAVAFDMGGTTTDVCLIAQGEAAILSERKLEGYPVRLPSVAVESIGAGGGSIAWVGPTGALKVGPRSAGARPGPACYGQGGTEPTVTDANLFLGYLEPASLLAGTISLDRERAAAAITPLAAQLGLPLEAAAEGIVTVANANMARALRLVSVQKGHDIRQFVLVAYGGAGPIHAGRLAGMLAIPRVIIPAHSSVFSAFGCLASEVRYDRVQTVRAPLTPGGLRGVAGALEALAKNAIAELAKDGYQPEEISVARGLDLRYVGQKYEIGVPVEGGAPEAEALRGRFMDRHRMLYHYVTEEPVECVNIRVAAVVRAEEVRLPPWPSGAGTPAPRGRHRAYFRETGWTELPVYDRPALGAGQAICGPALVADTWSTVLAYPGQHLRADSFGNLWIEAAP